MCFTMCMSWNPLLSHSHYLSFCLLPTPDHTLQFHYCLLFLPLFSSPSLENVMLHFLATVALFHICSHVHSRLIGYFLSSVFFLLLYRPSFYSSSTFPRSAFFLSLCILFSLPLSSSLSPSLSSAYVFALAQLSAAWSSCTHTQAAHICTSTCMPMTVWRSHSAISKHKGKMGGREGWEKGKVDGDVR